MQRPEQPGRHEHNDWWEEAARIAEEAGAPELGPRELNSQQAGLAADRDEDDAIASRGNVELPEQPPAD